MIVTWDADMFIVLNLITGKHEIKSNIPRYHDSGLSSHLEKSGLRPTLPYLKV